ncbi:MULTISPECIES: Cd(II)/Pb(II)-responsive transcriptional regulator [unclassified Caballeronia]|uniref:Cd(II)/Pb(II)-responsive transcriptional regulator n=1 Tax=unclassified Caballeronia TaxID=2646786 RepID=UPI00285BEFA3|nr:MULTISPECIES: Cd(II)/Pb(II)-responsive transcriptional regulator [unclassified Caballeronia]MDR5751341.1 Cd(II)/Pb(II)-responsive transcriptional regulator [Caballeronia sp. LZ024]MDR5844517.1 Cd(II)/Pb(II)-responsive transcriptional regulator [Caballeronia sp. LZ031]
MTVCIRTRRGALRRQHNLTDTIRFYEKEGLLPEADRTEKNYRSYNEGHIDRLRFIRNCRALDMTHDEVRSLLKAADGPATGCGVVNALVDEHIEHVNTRINELLQLRAQLIALRERCAGEQPVANCGIIHRLTSMESAQPNANTSHLG